MPAAPRRRRSRARATASNVDPRALTGAAVAIVLVFTLALVWVGRAACDEPAERATAASGTVAGYSGEQLTNAAVIMDVAADMGLTRQAQVLGVMTAMGESSLRVLDYGDDVGPDSRGLFQQRDNGYWGSYDDRMDPAESSRNFFEALVDVRDWEQLEPTIAAHRVQVNADPQHYTRYYGPAVAVVERLSGDSATCGE